MTRRVVVTGMGLITPLGVGIKSNWNKLLSGVSAISQISSFDITNYPCKIAGHIPVGENEGEFNPENVLPLKERRRVDDFILYGLSATMDAMEMAQYTPKTKEERERSGVLYGSGIGGLKGISNAAITLEKETPHKISPFLIPSVLINLIGGHISIKYGFEGPNLGLVTACATGTHAIGEAYRYIKSGLMDVMIAGGAESAICPVAMAGFGQARALSTHYNETPAKASRPFDEGRDGFVMGEGAGTFVLEEYEHAKNRGAKIYGEVIGYGVSGDAHHITAPGGDGAFRCMKMALNDARITPDEVDYINAHGTSTPLGDGIEVNSVKRLFGTNVSMSSTKGNTGHLLGAAGAIEAVYSILVLNNGVIPHTANLENPLEDAQDMDIVKSEPKEKKCKIALSNSFGFGGTNGSLVFKKLED